MSPEKKIIILKNRIRQNPGDYKSYAQIGDIYSQYGNFNGAIQAYLRAIKIKPKDEFNINRLGQALWKVKRYPEAFKQFKKALTINPKFAYAHLNIAKAFALVNNKSNAIAHARFAAKLFRKHGDKNGEVKAKQKLSELYK